MFRALGSTVLVLALLAGAAACSAGPEPTDAFTGPYGAQMRAAYESATDPAIKAALADGKITRAEYEAAVQRYVACAADKGVTITLHDQYGLYVYEVAQVPGADAALAACTPVIQTIESLYASITTNPQDLDWNDVVVGCLRRAGLVGPDYTGKQFKAWLDSSATSATSDGGQVVTSTADPGAATPPFDPKDPAVHRCIAAPQSDK
jgi:hypothetical protein